jgi:hypothetical protein
MERRPGRELHSGVCDPNGIGPQLHLGESTDPDRRGHLPELAGRHAVGRPRPRRRHPRPDASGVPPRVQRLARDTIPDGTPFELPEYRLAAEQEAKRLETEAATLFEEGNESNRVGDDFVLAAVLFASVLFFSGLAGTFDSLRAQVFLLILGAVMLAIGTIIVITLPQNVGF